MFAVNTDHIRRILNYDDAKYRYESIKHIRGKASMDIRPLGNRRAQHMRIEKGVIDGQEVYQCVLYSTPCVIWYPDGRVKIRYGSWVSQSTAKFINALLWGVGASLCYNHIVVWHNDNAYPVPIDGLWLKVVGGTWTITNPPLMYVHKYNRAETSRIRKLAKPILDYFKVMAPLMEGTERNYDEVVEAGKRFEERGNLSSQYPREWGMGTCTPAFAWAMKQEALDTETLADLMTLNGSCNMPVMYLYSTALKHGITDENRLYVKTYLKPGVVKPGMKIETEQS